MHIINITFCAKLKVYVRSLELFFTTFFEPVSSNLMGLSKGMKRMKNGEWRILEEWYETQSKWRKVRRGNFPTKRLPFKGINILNICSCEYFYYKKSALLFFISWTDLFFFCDDILDFGAIFPQFLSNPFKTQSQREIFAHFKCLEKILFGAIIQNAEDAE